MIGGGLQERCGDEVISVLLEYIWCGVYINAEIKCVDVCHMCTSIEKALARVVSSSSWICLPWFDSIDLLELRAN